MTVLYYGIWDIDQDLVEMTEKKLPFGLGRFFGKSGSSREPVSLPPITRGDLFRPEETIISFYAASSDSEEKICQQLAQQFPDDPEKIGRILEQVKIAREKKS